MAKRAPIAMESGQDPRTRAVLANPVRARLYELLLDSDRPRAIEELVDVLALHPNTVRWHLKQLDDVGLVASAPVASGERGRPASGYSATGLSDSAEEFRLLAGVMADTLADLPDGPRRAEVAGYELGRRLQGGRPALSSEEASERVTRFLARQGFAPERDGEAILMRRCPFLDLVLKDDGHQALVCGIHHGLVQGALSGMAAPAEVAEFTPFKTAQSCLIRLRALDAESDQPGADEG